MSKYISNLNADNAALKSNLGIVFSVILDSTHPKYRNASDIGGVTFKMVSPVDGLNDTQLPIAYPLEKNFIDLPLVNEQVEIVRVGNINFYRRIDNDVVGNKNISSAYDLITARFGGKNNEDKEDYGGDKLKNYERAAGNNIARSSDVGVLSKNYNGYGSYFSPINIHRLTLNEGDTLIESRFGQSIRFSGYNNPAKRFAPTLIIRNSESPLTRATPPWR